MYIGINQHYREGLELLNRVTGYEQYIRYKRIYPASGPYHPENASQACLNCPHRNRPGCAAPDGAAAGGPKAFFFLLEAGDQAPGAETPGDLETLMQEKPFAMHRPDADEAGPGANRYRPEQRHTATLSGPATSDFPTSECSLLSRETDRQTFKNLDILESVLSAREEFSMLDVGAGYGRDTVAANAMVRALGRPLNLRLTAVEPDPMYHRFLTEHLEHNCVPCRTISCAVSDHEGSEGFLGLVPTPEGAPSQTANKNYFLVRTTALDTLLEDSEYVDLVVLNIRHAEGRVVPASSLLTEKVRKVHVHVHSEQTGMHVRTRFDHLNWINVWDFPPATIVQTRFGPVGFYEGVQTWINPKYY